MELLPLTQGYVAIVDEEDYERLKRFKWYVTANTYGNKYAARSLYKNGWAKQVFLHHEVLGLISITTTRPVFGS